MMAKHAYLKGVHSKFCICSSIAVLKIESESHIFVY